MMASELILVVDDEDSGRFVKVQTLKRAGFRVIEAATGQEGLELIGSTKPALVVLDVNLPDMSGLEIARRLRETRNRLAPSIQILQVSHTAIQNADRVRGLEHGADVYLTEPIDGDVLVATVQSLLRVRNAEIALAQALDSEKRARTIAEEASRLKDEFIATLSHELRTPLNALMGWIWQLQHTALTDDARTRALESLERNARTQAQLINDLLDVSRISKGKLQLEMRLIDLGSVVTSVVDTLREPIARKRLKITTSATSVVVAGDRGRLQQVVTNLLTNAVQFTPSEGEIDVSVTVDGDDAVVRVSDSGAGIDPAILPHIFDPFRQGEGGLSRQHGGLGLGLAVVRQLVELHGGTTAVESEGIGLGATFIVRLPCETVVPRQPPAADGQPLLSGVQVQIAANEGTDYSSLIATLESSGASVNLTFASEPASDQPSADLIVSLDKPSGGLTLATPSSAPAASEIVPNTAAPGDVVRRVARFITNARA